MSLAGVQAFWVKLNLGGVVSLDCFKIKLVLPSGLTVTVCDGQYQVVEPEKNSNQGEIVFLVSELAYVIFIRKKRGNGKKLLEISQFNKLGSGDDCPSRVKEGIIFSGALHNFVQEPPEKLRSLVELVNKTASKLK